MKRLTVAVLVVAMASVVGAAAVRVVHVHRASGTWGLVTPSETPDRLSYLGRSYDRSGPTPTGTAPSDLEPRGETGGGGTVLVPTGLRMGTPLVIYVRDDDGGLWTYGLAGGP